MFPHAIIAAKMLLKGAQHGYEPELEEESESKEEMLSYVDRVIEEARRCACWFIV